MSNIFSLETIFCFVKFACESGHFYQINRFIFVVEEIFNKQKKQKQNKNKNKNKTKQNKTKQNKTKQNTKQILKAFCE